MKIDSKWINILRCLRFSPYRHKAAFLTGILVCLCLACRAEAYDGLGYPNEIWGTVTGVSEDCLIIVGEALTDGGLEEVIVDTSAAEVFNLLTGYPAGLRDVEPGMRVRVAYGTLLTDTFPPLACADMVWLNYGEEGSAALKVAVSENIHYNNGLCTFVTNDGKYRVTLTADTMITDAYNGYIAPEDIRPGMIMFMWVDMVTASFPGQAYPEKVTLVEPESPYIPSYMENGEVFMY